MNFCVLRFPIRCQIATCFSKGENSKIKHFKIPHTDKIRFFEISFLPKFALLKSPFYRNLPFDFLFFFHRNSPFWNVFFEKTRFFGIFFFVRIFLCRFLRANWARKIERKEPFSMHEKMLTGLIGLSVRSFAFNDFWPFPIFSPHQN